MPISQQCFSHISVSPISVCQKSIHQQECQPNIVSTKCLSDKYFSTKRRGTKFSFEGRGRWAGVSNGFNGMSDFKATFPLNPPHPHPLPAAY